MQPEHHHATSRNLRMVTQCHVDVCADRRLEPDTRRFAAIFPLEVSEEASVDGSDTTQEEHNDSDDLSRFRLVAALDQDNSTTQVASLASVDESSTLSAAQQIMVRYRAVHAHDRTPEHSLTEKELPQVPDDQCSMYTLATSTDTQSVMDMTWRPKPKVHMRRTDQRALMQAQSQAIAMMRDAGLKPTNKIQCRRRGCADILSDVEALKYHLHIHNIADSTGRRRNAPPSSACEPPSLVGCSMSTSETFSLGTRHKCSTTLPLPRKLSGGSLFPSIFSCEGTLSQVPSLATVARALTPDLSPHKLAGSAHVRNDETPSRPSTPFRGRKRKESITVPVGTNCSPTIAMLLSPPTSPIMRGRAVHVPRVKLPGLHLAENAENNNCVSIRNETAHSVSERLTGSRSPVRALSPTRAMSPIRNGVRRILSIGSPDSVSDK